MSTLNPSNLPPGVTDADIDGLDSDSPNCGVCSRALRSKERRARGVSMDDDEHRKFMELGGARYLRACIYRDWPLHQKALRTCAPYETVARTLGIPLPVPAAYHHQPAKKKGTP